MKRALAMVSFALILTVSHPATAVVEGGGGPCEFFCKISTIFCEILGCTPKPGGGGSGGGVGWDRTTPCTRQVPRDHEPETFSSCDTCCHTIFTPLDADRDACIALCIEDHG